MTLSIEHISHTIVTILPTIGKLVLVEDTLVERVRHGEMEEGEGVGVVPRNVSNKYKNTLQSIPVCITVTH